MPSYNPHIHHRRSIRLQGYDYAQEGLYFITLCCQNREHLFGEIIDGEMKLNAFGEIAFKEWENTPNIRKNIALHEFIIMPNHIHGIIEIKEKLNREGEFQLAPTEKGNAPNTPSEEKILQLDFKIWQRNYYEHIIKDEKAYDNISNYIINNPLKWGEDKFYN